MDAAFHSVTVVRARNFSVASPRYGPAGGVSNWGFAGGEGMQGWERLA